MPSPSPLLFVVQDTPAQAVEAVRGNGLLCSRDYGPKAPLKLRHAAHQITEPGSRLEFHRVLHVPAVPSLESCLAGEEPPWLLGAGLFFVNPCPQMPSIARPGAGRVLSRRSSKHQLKPSQTKALIRRLPALESRTTSSQGGFLMRRYCARDFKALGIFRALEYVPGPATLLGPCGPELFG